MPPVLLPDTDGVVRDDFLLSVQAFVTKTSASTINTCMHAWSVIAGDHFFSNYCTLLLHKSYYNQASRRRRFFVSLWCLMGSGHIINLSDLLIAFGVFHLPTNAMQATTTPSAANMPTVSVQLLRKCFAQLSIRTCRHGGGEHVVLAATAVCMCLQRRGSATFSTSSLYV